MRSGVKASIMITCLGDLFFLEVGAAMVTVLHGPKEVHAVFVDTLEGPA